MAGPCRHRALARAVGRRLTRHAMGLRLFRRSHRTARHEARPPLCGRAGFTGTPAREIPTSAPWPGGPLVRRWPRQGARRSSTSGCRPCRRNPDRRHRAGLAEPRSITLMGRRHAVGGHRTGAGFDRSRGRGLASTGMMGRDQWVRHAPPDTPEAPLDRSRSTGWRDPAAGSIAVAVCASSRVATVRVGVTRRILRSVGSNRWSSRPTLLARARRSDTLDTDGWRGPIPRPQKKTRSRVAHRGGRPRRPAKPERETPAALRA